MSVIIFLLALPFFQHHGNHKSAMVSIMIENKYIEPFIATVFLMCFKPLLGRASVEKHRVLHCLEPWNDARHGLNLSGGIR